MQIPWYVGAIALIVLTIICLALVVRDHAQYERKLDELRRSINKDRKR